MTTTTQFSNNNINNILNFGLNFGMFYQLLNDIEDYYKSGNDIAEGRITLPVIFVLNNLINMPLKQKLINLIKNYANNARYKQLEHLELIKNTIINHDGFEYTMTIARQYLDKAKKSIIMITDFNEFNGSKYKQAILRMVDDLLSSSSNVIYKCINYGV